MGHKRRFDHTPDVWLSPDSGEKADIPQPPLGAISGPVQRSKVHRRVATQS